MEFLDVLMAFSFVGVFFDVLYYGFLITLYVLGSLGLYTIAKRRGISNAWMAWFPLLNVWVLGSVSDQYQYVKNGKVRNLRKWLLFLTIAVIILAIVLMVMILVFSVTQMISENMYTFTEIQNASGILSRLIPVIVVAPIYVIACIALTVLTYVAYYRVFLSCDPENKTLYLVLGIFLSFLLPIFTFVCRNKDFGMPPRKDVPPAPMYMPAYPYAPQAPTYQQPAEPWTAPQEQDQ